MKNPLHYQISEYDCGPTSMLNGISYLFEREEIPAELIRNIMIYALDCYGNDGAPAVLLFNTKTVITAEATIEYFI